MLTLTQHAPSGSWPGLAAGLHLLLFLPASSSQAEKELTDSPATSKRISFPGSSESPLSSKRPKTSEETKPEQVRLGGAVLWESISDTWGEWGGEWSLRLAGMGQTLLPRELRSQPAGGCVPHRCTSVPIASTAMPTSTGCACTPWRSTRCSPCSAALSVRTCSTTRSTSSCTSPTYTAWRPTVWRSSSWR